VKLNWCTWRIKELFFVVFRQELLWSMIVRMSRENHQEKQKYVKAVVVIILIGLGFALTYALSGFNSNKIDQNFEESIQTCYFNALYGFIDYKTNNNSNVEDVKQLVNYFLF